MSYVVSKEFSSLHLELTVAMILNTLSLQKQKQKNPHIMGYVLIWGH
jgi:hypothetical protein